MERNVYVPSEQNDDRSSLVRSNIEREKDRDL